MVKKIEQIFSIKIDNLIQNYCYNFLSYLYTYNGWKRAIFDSSKENYIPSSIKGKNIRILISNTGSILLTCYCCYDLLIAMEYIVSQFQYGRMEYYLILNEKINMKCNFSEKYLLEEYLYEEKIDVSNNKGGGLISLDGDEATISYETYEDGKELREIFLDVFSKKPEIKEDKQIEIKEDKQIEIKEDKQIEIKEDKLNCQHRDVEMKSEEKKIETVENRKSKKKKEGAEKYLITAVFLWSTARLLELF